MAVNRYTYDKNVDYQKEINQAVGAGDYSRAAVLEQQRNAKIRGEGATQYAQTSHYVDYLPKTQAQPQAQHPGSLYADTLAKAQGGQGQRQDWSYDVDQDPAYQAMRKQYLREAERQTRDVLGAYAGQTGGVPSTAAVSAAQQAGNYQRAQLTDRIPELMQAAYSRYAAEQDNARQDAQQAISNAMSRWAALGYADEGVAQVLGVPVGSSTADAQYQQWQRQQTEQGNAYDRAMRWISLGLMPDEATLGAAGIDRSMAQQAVAQAQGDRYAGGSGSGSGGGSGSGSSRRSSSGKGPGSGDGSEAGKTETTVNAAGKGLSSDAYNNLLALIRAAGSYDRAYQILAGVRNDVSASQAEEIGHILARLYPVDKGRVNMLN